MKNIKDVLVEIPTSILSDLTNCKYDLHKIDKQCSYFKKIAISTPEISPAAYILQSNSHLSPNNLFLDEKGNVLGETNEASNLLSCSELDFTYDTIECWGLVNYDSQ